MAKILLTRTTWWRRIFICFCLTLTLVGLWAQIGTTDATLLYFPYFVSIAGDSTGIAIFNPSEREAVVRLTATDGKGVLISSATVRVPARGQTARTANDIFGSLTIDGYLEVSSSTAGLTAYYQAFDSDGTYMDGAEPPQPATFLIFPVIPSTSEGEAKIGFLNTNSIDTSAELKLWSTGGDLLGTAKIIVPARGLNVSLPGSIFPSGTNFDNASHITATSRPKNVFSEAQTILGTSLFYGFSSVPTDGTLVDLAGINALTLSQTSNTGTIPYFRAGGQFASTVSVVNVEPAAIDVTLTAVSNSGTTLGTRRINLRANGGYRAAMQNAFSGFPSGEQEGWILVSASGRVAASVIYGRSDAESLAVVGMQKAPQFDFVFNQVVQTSSMFTEVSLTNTSPATSFADVYVVDTNGVTQGINQILIGANRRVSRPLNPLLPEITSQTGGYVFVRASEPLFATVSIGTTSNKTLSNFTPGNVPGSYAPAALKSFAVTGRITLNDRPAKGFPVILSGPSGRTTTADKAGFYAFTGLKAGKYSMSVDQFGFTFVPANVNFDLTKTSVRQDFTGMTGRDEIVVQPASVPVRSPDVTVTIFGSDFNATSEAFAEAERLKTTFIDANQLEAVIPAHLMATPKQFDIHVATDGSSSNRRVSKTYRLVAFVDRPTLTRIDTPGDIAEGSAGTTIRLIGTGFLENAAVKVNGSSDGIVVNYISATLLTAYVPASYFARGGIFPVTVQNPYPANVESAIQLLTVYHPAPAVDEIIPKTTTVKLEEGAGAIDIEVLGYNFRRGAIVNLLDPGAAAGTRLATTYCENDNFCLAVHLFAKIPAELLRESGFAEIAVENPEPSLKSASSAVLRIDGLRPTITSVLPGTSTVLTSANFTMPVVVSGTNFSKEQTSIRIYKVGTDPLPAFSGQGLVVLSTRQLHAPLIVKYPDAIGEWRVEVSNPQPGGGKSEPTSFSISEGNLASNPFLISLTPEVVAAGGSSFTLTVNGTNLKSGSQINFNQSPLVTTFVSSKQVRAEVPALLIERAGRYPVSVTNPDEGGTSNLLFVEVR